MNPRSIDPSRPNDYGYYHESEIPDLDICRDMIIGCIHALFETGSVSELDNCLQELASEFEIEFPENRWKLCNSYISNFCSNSLMEAAYKRGFQAGIEYKKVSVA